MPFALLVSILGSSIRSSTWSLGSDSVTITKNHQL